MMTRRNLLLLLATVLSVSAGTQTESIEVEVNDGLVEEASSLRRRELYDFGTFSFSSLLCEFSECKVVNSPTSQSTDFMFLPSLYVSSRFALMRC